MANRSIKRPGDVSRLAKTVIDLVTGNPINEDVSPIAKRDRDTLAVLRDEGKRIKDKKRSSEPTR